MEKYVNHYKHYVMEILHLNKDRGRFKKKAVYLQGIFSWKNCHHDGAKVQWKTALSHFPKIC
jgi:hypothetical protein